MKKRKKKKNGLSKYVDKYNKIDTKGNIQNTLLKGLIDIAGVAAGTGLGALAGKNSKFVGLATILGGHYLGDKSNILRIIGASTMAYGIGKAKEYNSNPELATPKGRFSDLKDDWFATLYIKMKDEKSETKTKESEVTIEEIVPEQKVETKENETPSIEKEDDFSGLDLSRWDTVEEQVKESEKDFQYQEDSINNQENDDSEEDEFDNPDFSSM